MRSNVPWQKAVLSQSSDVKRHHISTLLSQRVVSVQKTADHVVAELWESNAWRVRLPFVVQLNR
jgi:hypothetical protein